MGEPSRKKASLLLWKIETYISNVIIYSGAPTPESLQPSPSTSSLRDDPAPAWT